ncbi:MAG TPA: 4-(cytidine 5'-diphospho)-2-C-methyl-D-erythritol kinase [Dehalococcoidales bacterium]|nr:4-(cytidine 5'-diphospho)-2-C-methyl-D-erythritol kinase [Dehalococcoidales bacterium]
MLTLNAPAKINLTLEVLGKRPDGYHDIKSVVQTIALFDTLSIEEAERVTFECDLPGWSAEKSVLSKVIDSLGVKKGAKISLQKRIPMMAGLGGDSSCAAALLKGLNVLWKLKLSTKKLREITREIGSDIPFFLNGPTALMEGRGEKLTSLPSLPKVWVVLIMPDVPNASGKTARLYAALKTEHFTDGKITDKLVSALHKNSFDESMLFNTFENVAYDEFPGLKKYREDLLKLGAKRVHLAGSGPALYGLFKEKIAAVDFYQKCIDEDLNSCLAVTL